VKFRVNTLKLVLAAAFILAAAIAAVRPAAAQIGEGSQDSRVGAVGRVLGLDQICVIAESRSLPTPA
jgi:hypothetical protein